MRRTKIVATLGPSTRGEEALRGLLRAGADVVRLNLSHGSREEHALAIRHIRRLEEELGRPVGVMLDTRGPELRLRRVVGRRRYQREELLVLGVDSLGDAAEGCLVAPLLPTANLEEGAPCLIDDGKARGEVVAKEEGRVVVRLRTEASLREGSKVAFPATKLGLPSLTREDEADLSALAPLGYDFVAQSFVEEPEDVLALRDFLAELGVGALVVAKVETRAAVLAIERIARVADGLMVARGDLGVAFPVAEVPVLQRRLIAQAARLGKPVVTATQMLESMVEHGEPTRAEASDVAHAIWDGSDAVMLSAETAVGAFPGEAVAVMAAIAEEADRVLEPRLLGEGGGSIPDAISRASAEVAEELGVAVVACATTSGSTARMIARHRPRRPILAATPDIHIARQLTLVWGTIPTVIPKATSADRMTEEVLAAVRRLGLAGDGDGVLVTFGVPVGVPGTTNALEVHLLGSARVLGQGIGGQVVTGVVRRWLRPQFPPPLDAESVVVVRATDETMARHLEGVKAIVAEEGGLTSHAALLGVSLGIPVVVGAAGALSRLEDGEVVTVDARRGVVLGRGDA